MHHTFLEIHRAARRGQFLHSGEQTAGLLSAEHHKQNIPKGMKILARARLNDDWLRGNTHKLLRQGVDHVVEIGVAAGAVNIIVRIAYIIEGKVLSIE